MPIKDIKLICHKTKTGKGRTYEKRIAVCVCDHCGKEWDAKRFDINKPLVFCSRDCVNLSSKNGGKIDDRKRQTCIDRFGVDNALKSETVQERKRKRCLEKYGVEHVQHTDEWKEKRRKAIYAKFGDEMFKSEEFKTKSRETCLKKYGKNYYSQTSEHIERRNNTWLEKYGCHPMSVTDIINKMFETNITRYGYKTSFDLSAIQTKAYQARLGFSREEYLESLPEYMAYRNEVRKITENQPLHELEFSDKHRSRHEYHLDHVYSIRQGFLDFIPPEIIGHITNLRFIPAKTNIKKGSSCDITKQELLKNYDQRVSKKN